MSLLPKADEKTDFTRTWFILRLLFIVWFGYDAIVPQRDGGRGGMRKLSDNPRLELRYAVETMGRYTNRTPVAVIVWTSTQGGGSGQSSQGRGITHINGHALKGSRRELGVYALRPDYLVEKLDLADDEARIVLQTMRSNNAIEITELWQQKILPVLSLVDPSPATTVLD